MNDRCYEIFILILSSEQNEIVYA